MRIVYPICFLDEFFYPFLSFKIRGRIFIRKEDCNALNFYFKFILKICILINVLDYIELTIFIIGN